MATYNHAPFIDQAITSALAQTWQDFELIVVDDGSSDATGEIVGRFGDRVYYIYQQNRGQGGARNRGIAEACGDFICFLDDDDLWEPHYLATVMSFFQRQPDTDALYTGFRIIDADGNLLPQKGARVVVQDQMYDALMGGGWFPPLVVTVRKTCLDRVGSLDETLRGHDDWDLWLRISRDNVFRGIPEALARYRIHTGGLSADFNHMLRDQKLAIAKHFGPEEGSPTSWPSQRRRAYGAAYRTAAFACLQAKDPVQGYAFLNRAIEIDPDLLLRVDTFYELALGCQPRGYRGDAQYLDLTANSGEMLRWLDTLFASTAPHLAGLHGPAYGHAYLALAMLSDQVADWAAARRFLWRALLFHPQLAQDPSIIRRLFKLFAGQQLVDSVRHLWFTVADNAAQSE